MDRRNFFQAAVASVLSFLGLSPKAEERFLHITYDMDGKVYYYYGLLYDDFVKGVARGDEKSVELLKQHFLRQFSDFVDFAQKKK